MDRNPASQLGHVVRIVRKTLDQFDIRFPASHSFISYPIACEAVQFRAPPTFLLSGGHTAFPIREWLCYGPGFKTRRILSCVLQEQEAPILRGNLGISRCKLEILKGLGLRGGPDRDRSDDLFHTMENQQLTAQTAKELSAGIAVKTGTVGANWHQIDAKNSQLHWA